MHDESLLTVFQNAIRLVKARGYRGAPPEKQAFSDSRTAWKRQFPDRVDLSLLNFETEPRPDMAHRLKGGPICVFFVVEPKLGVKEVRVLTEYLEERHLKRCLLVIQGAQTPAAKKEVVKNCAEKELTIEVFTYLELLTNVLEHYLVPKHEPLTEEEKRVVMAEKNVTAEQIPRIRVSDPVLRWLGVTKNTLVRITRKAEGDGEEYMTFRMAVP